MTHIARLTTIGPYTPAKCARAALNVASLLG
jgi:hypothetical protein